MAEARNYEDRIMRGETVEELRREEALIKAWIRDITAPKMARLREIRGKMKGFVNGIGPKRQKHIFR